MLSGDQIASLAVEVLTAGAALYGVWRCVSLQRFATDRRLSVLAWFFGLFAVAMVFNAVWEAQTGAPAGSFGFGHEFQSRNVTSPPPGDHGFFGPQGEEHANVWLTIHHALMLASFVVAVWAFGHRRPSAVLAAPAVLPLFLSGADVGLATGLLLKTMLALEACLTLYLAAVAFLNHVEVRSAGAVQVALGFGLFFIGHLLVYVTHAPGFGHNPLGDILNLVGIALLVQALPGKRR